MEYISLEINQQAKVDSLKIYLKITEILWQIREIIKHILENQIKLYRFK